MSRYKIVVFALLFLGIASGLASSQSLAQQFCTDMFPASMAASMQSLVSVSLLIMLAMFSVVGVVYMFGYAFQLNSFVVFCKAEIGEIAMTVLVIAVFSAFIYTSNSVAVIPQLSPTASQGYFTSDCTYLSLSSVNVFATLATYYWPNIIALQLKQNIEIKIAPVNFGINGFKPLDGINLIVVMVNRFAAFTGFLATVLLGMVALLSIIYSVFPLFLYAGIVLRTIPFTRAAGGAMLGFFIGFYLMFPMMLYLTLSIYPSAGAAAPSGAAAGTILSTLFTIGAPCSGLACNLINAIATISIKGEIQNFAYLVLDPMIYTILALAVSVILSFDFTEMVSGLLGSPSLSSRSMFRKIL